MQLNVSLITCTSKDAAGIQCVVSLLLTFLYLLSEEFLPLDIKTVDLILLSHGPHAVLNTYLQVHGQGLYPF